MAMFDNLIGGFSKFIGVSEDTVLKAGKAGYDAYTKASKEAESSVSSADLTRGTLSTSYGQEYRPGRVQATPDAVSNADIEALWKARLNAFAYSENKANQTRIGRDARNKYFG